MSKSSTKNKTQETPKDVEKVKLQWGKKIAQKKWEEGLREKNKISVWIFAICFFAWLWFFQNTPGFINFLLSFAMIVSAIFYFLTKKYRKDN